MKDFLLILETKGSEGREGGNLQIDRKETKVRRERPMQSRDKQSVKAEQRNHRELPLLPQYKTVNHLRQ
jgi:hypothetical protein